MDTATPSTRPLLRLKLSATNDPSPDYVIGQLCRGDDLLMRVSCPMPGADLSPSQGPSRLREVGDPARAAPPSELAAQLRAMAAFVQPDDVLWIELARPKGCLTTQPWERWLSPIVRRPLLRVPRFPFKPIRPAGGLHVAYCASAAAARGQFDPVASLVTTCDWLIRAGIDATFHVFLDPADRERLALAIAVQETLASRLQVHVPPAALSETTRDPATAGDPLASPWLQWIASALPPRGVDVVHFVSHGYLSRGRGAIALARHPVSAGDTTIARLVYADELVRLLDIAGASGVILTSPPQNESVSGLLALADELIGCRPGPVVFHDAERDEASVALGKVLAFLYGAGPPPISSALAVCVHPDRLAEPVAPKFTITGSVDKMIEGVRPLDSGDAIVTPGAAKPPTSEEPAAWTDLYQPPAYDAATTTSFDVYRRVLEKYTLATRVKDIDTAAGAVTTLGPGRTDPNWLMSCQRVLERHTAQLASAPLESSTVGQAEQEGVEEALRYVKSVMEDVPGKDGV